MLRATLRSLLSHKLRLALSGFSIVLGVMFIAGALILTDSLTNRVSKLFETVNSDVAVAVVRDADSAATDAAVPEADLQRLKDTDGVARATGDIAAENVVPYDKQSGEPVRSSGPPQLGGLFEGEDPLGLVKLAEGDAPAADDQIAVTRYTAEQANWGVGDKVKVFVATERKPIDVTVVGILEYSGNRASLGGETFIGFTKERAQQLFLGGQDAYTEVYLQADDGVSQAALRDRVAEAVPEGYVAKTGAQQSEDQAGELNDILENFRTFLVVFAVIALFVGTFLIFNTFAMLVAQRGRELALMRAVGASRGQVLRSVLAEAVIVGLLGSTIGLAAGYGIAAALQSALNSLGVELPDGPVLVTGWTVLWSYLAGVTITVVAALVPAMRASRVAPVEALRETAAPITRALTKTTIVGIVLAVIGAAVTGYALTGIGDSTLPVLGGGVAAVFLGVALLSPLLSRPIVAVLGRPLSWGAASRLGRRNAGRSPGRTAVTAAALMVGLALVSAVSVFGTSLQASIDKSLNESLGADVIINTQANQEPTGNVGFDPKALDQVRQIDGVDNAIPGHVNRAIIDGRDEFLYASDIDRATRLFGITAETGKVTGLGERDLLVDERTAKDRGWEVGSTVEIHLAKGGEQDWTVAGVYEQNPTVAGIMLPVSAVSLFDGPLAFQGLVNIDDDADSAAVLDEIESVMAAYPLVSVLDREAYNDQVSGQVNVLIYVVTGLLALALLIAVLGIVNTLALSVIERTRELGMLRAVGLSRWQTTRMVTTESVVIAGFGGLLGLAVGTVLGVALTRALESQGVTVIDVPEIRLAVFFVVALIAGVLAALWPAIRAARLNMLRAIAAE